MSPGPLSAGRNAHPGRRSRWRRLAVPRHLLLLFCVALPPGVACGDDGVGNRDSGVDASVADFTLSPDPLGVAPGATRTVTVTLAEPATAERRLTLAMDDPAVATAPSEATVEAGERQTSFVVTGQSAGETTLRVAGYPLEVHVVAPGFACEGATTGTLSPGGSLVAEDAGDLSGAAVVDPGDQLATPLTARSASLSCVEDIAPEGFVPLGPAVKVDLSDGLLEKWVELTLPYKSALLPDGAHSGHLQVAVKLRNYPTWTPPLPNLWPETHPSEGRLTFRYDEGATFQVVVPQSAGQPKGRLFTYRAVFGFSMGGGAAGAVGLRNPERFDFVVQNGGEPGIDMIYSLRLTLDYLLGGFCTALDEAEGVGSIGELCPSRRLPLTRQYEIPSSYEHWVYEPYEGTYIYLRREFYLRAMRDLVRAFGNPFFYNPSSPILPPGVPASHLADEAPCDNPVVLQNFYHRDYNPDGAYPVITYCDASDNEDSPDLGIAVFDPALPKTNPAYLALAVDVNGNGRRDSGEPVLTMSHEPFSDWGIDGLPDASEIGYDPETNPDPAGDNYHWMKNPAGTEGNWQYDEGEPFEDSGLDGITGMGCEVDASALGCYDHGEGNGQFDVTPGWVGWLQHGARTLYSQLTPEQQARITVWSDSGMRDFFNCHVSTNQFVGQQAMQGENVRTYFGFQRLINDPVRQTNFDFQRVNYDELSRHLYVHYGNPDASESQIALGDGRHVGTALEVIYRFNTPISFLSRRWPGGDFDLENDDRDYTEHFLGTGDNPLTFTASNGRETHYGVYLPPGYFLEKNQDLRYPVIYFLHGYGQDPDDLIALSGVFENYMISPNISDHARYQKLIIVYVDGRCRPGGVIGTDGNNYTIWDDLGADQCERGTFYADSPTGSAAQAESQLLELMDIIDADYRTKDPETRQVID